MHGWIFLGGGRRGGDDRLLHVPPLVPDLRRPAARRARLPSRPRIAPRRWSGRWWCWPRWRCSRAGTCRGRISGLEPLLEQARPAGIDAGASAGWHSPRIVHPPEHLSPRGTRSPASRHALGLRRRLGRLPAGHGDLRPADDRRRRRSAGRFASLAQFPRPQVVVRRVVRLAVGCGPSLRLSQFVAELDTEAIDRLADGAARLVAGVARLDDWIDRLFVDGLVNLTARWTLRGRPAAAGRADRQRAAVRHAIGLGTVVLFILTSFFWNFAIRANVSDYVHA